MASSLIFFPTALASISLHPTFWSKSLNVHFGYYTRGSNPFRHEQMLQKMNLVVAQLLGVPKENPCKILDMGCGYGSTALQILSLFPNASITGINANASQVAVANDRLVNSKYTDRASFIVADFHAMPFPDDSFDAAYALESACFAEGKTKSKFIGEAARVLRPGGRLVVVDGFRKHDRPLPRLINWLYQKSIAAWGMPSLPPIDGFENALQNQGFTNITIRDISWNIAPSLLHIPWTALKLFAAHLLLNDRKQLRYLHALLLTLTLSPFRRHFGYYLVTCRKR